MSDDFVYPGEITRSNVLDAIYAAGHADQIAFADGLCKSYSLDVCRRCALEVDTLHFVSALQVPAHIKAQKGCVCPACARALVTPIGLSGMTRTVGTIAFSNSNGVTFGMQGTTITASMSPNATVRMVNSAQPAFSPFAMTSGVMSR